MIKAVKFVSIPVRDQDASLEFYTERLGLTVATDQPFDGKQRWIELRIPGAETRLVLFTMQGWESRIGGPANVVFLADDVRRTWEELRDRGVEFVAEPKSEAWGTSAIFKDPDGNQFVLSSR